MPLVKIDMFKGVRSPEEIKKLANVMHEVMREKFHAPPRDRYQIITQHKPYELICEDTNLGFTRTSSLVIIQIFHQGRTAEEKQALYTGLARRLQDECALGGEDLIVSCVRNEKEDWSFGMGKAQFLVGDLYRS